MPSRGTALARTLGMKKLLMTSLVLTALAVACGTSTSSASPSASASASLSAVSSSPSASAVPSSSGASAASVGDACGLLAKSDVEAVVGTVTDQPAATSAPMTGVADRASVCAYRGANGLLTIAVLTKAMTRTDFDSLMRQVPGVQPISGIGDAAYGTSAGTNGAT